MKAINPSLLEFKQLAAGCTGGPVPFVVSLPNDQLTPVTVYSNLCGDSEHAFFLESVNTGSQVGRYSFMGANPRKIFSCQEGRFFVRDATGEVISEQPCVDPLHALQEQMEPLRARWPAELDLPPLVGGVVGFLSYDCVHYFEPVGALLPNEIDMPEMLWMLTDTIVCFDHLHSNIMLINCVLPEEIEAKGLDSVYAGLIDETEAFADKYLRQSSFTRANVRQVLAQNPGLGKRDSNFTEHEFHVIVQQAKEHIRAGDIFQVVPSQRFSLPLSVPALDVYRALRKINPSAYMFALKFGSHEVVGSSPETQLRCKQGQMMMRPLAGSRPRTGDNAVDAKSARELLRDEKELAEHRMLVDLVRNDLGRVAQAGTVKVVRLMEVEKYSHVMHMTSEVVAQLSSRHSVYNAIRSAFPAGTLSGAPKIRAMQLINEFEQVRRNLYGGMVGYIDYNGNSDSCIAIRMMMSHAGKAYVQAGCGLVADSVPATEYAETINKASAVLQAIAEAEGKT